MNQTVMHCRKMHVDAFIMQHKYIEYCEAIIYPDGTVQYSVPSHIEALIRILCMQEKCTRDELWNMVPLNSTPIDYLVEKTKCIAVWYNHLVQPSYVNPIQRDVIERLHTHGIIKVYDNMK